MKLNRPLWIIHFLRNWRRFPVCVGCAIYRARDIKKQLHDAQFVTAKKVTKVMKKYRYFYLAWGLYDTITNSKNLQEVFMSWLRLPACRMYRVWPWKKEVKEKMPDLFWKALPGNNICPPCHNSLIMIINFQNGGLAWRCLYTRPHIIDPWPLWPRGHTHTEVTLKLADVLKFVAKHVLITGWWMWRHTALYLVIDKYSNEKG